MESHCRGTLLYLASFIKHKVYKIYPCVGCSHSSSLFVLFQITVGYPICKIHHNLFIYSLVDRYLGSITSILVQVLWGTCVVTSVEYKYQSWPAGSQGVHMFYQYIL